MRIGSLCSGYGGLDLAVEKVFGAETVWHCEVDAAASKVLEKRWARVPNHGDLTAMDWSTVEPVDVVAAGWPCQPWSLAGKKRGAEDERAIWPEIARAVRELRPRFVCLENVSAVVVLGELARAAGDLAEAGYDTQWTCLSASEIGAPHKRERFFLLASDTESGGWDYGPAADLGAADREVDSPWHDSHTAGVELLPTPKASDASGGKHNSEGHADSLPGTVRLLPTPCARDFKDATASPGAVSRNTPSLGAIEHYLPTPAAVDGARGPDFARAGREGSGGDDLVTICARATRGIGSQWGKYAPAITQWERVTRPAPSPTEPNSKGNQRLSAQFAEWMMGIPAGWVTDVDIPRSAQLKCIGNGVVPLQAEAALRWLLSVCEVAA